MMAMRTTDYLINAVFVLIVFRQARERELDRRSVIIPLAIVAYVAHLYVRSIPTAGNDLVLIAALGTVGLTLGVASGFATRVRAGENGLAVARVGWIAGGLLIAGIGSRMVFAFASRSQRRSEEHTSELQSRQYLVCRLLLQKKKQPTTHSN